MGLADCGSRNHFTCSPWLVVADTVCVGVQCSAMSCCSVETPLLLGSSAVVATLLILSALALGQVAENATGDEALAAKVKTLLGKQGLGSDELAKREAAEKALIAIGPEVLPLLPSETPRTPAEEKVRLGR